jgi:citrate lyase beta subunit
MPALDITEAGGRICLNLGGFAQGEGLSLQEAADELVRRILELALAFRSNGCQASREVRPDLETMNFLHELGEIAAAGGDIRERVFD